MKTKDMPSGYFVCGYLAAAAEVMRLFDNPTIARQLMATAGVTSRKELQAAGLEKFDLEPLMKVCK